MRYATLLFVILCVLGIICPQAVAQVPGVKLVSSGEFTDKGGGIHSWKVTGSHTLVWDGQPWIPVGGVFYPRYVCLDQTEENWQADIKTLESLKNAGITDLILKTITPITWTNPKAWQRLLDWLDSSGFTYGIDLSDGPKSPLAGMIIQPSRYRVPDIIKDQSLTFDMPDVTSALWMLCSASDGTVYTSGGASVVDGKVSVDVKARPDQNCVLLLYPKREFATGTSDLWGGFDEFRDRLIIFFGQLKFGKGLRFFVDPITNAAGLEGEWSLLIPDSPEFRLEFEAYLAKKYLNIGSLNAAWGLRSVNLESFQEASRMIPLWHGARGIPAIYDRARGRRLDIDVPRSKIWDDIGDFRDMSTQSYLNTAADLLKHNAADVPVIYNAASYHRILANSTSRGGFDGLGVHAFGRGLDLVTNEAGPAYSLAEESARSMWFVVTATQDTPLRGKSIPGYESRESMFADLDSLAEIGVKGLFVFGLQVLPEQTWKNHSLALLPEQLGWLKEFKDNFSSNERADFVPEVVYYPSQPIVGAETKRLGPGQWWLPSLKSGSSLYLGDTIGAYVLNKQDGICLWSRTGPMTATFPLLSGQKPEPAYPAGEEGLMKIEKNKAVLKLDNSPTLVTGLDPLQLFPVEMVEAEFDKLGPLVAKAALAGNRIPSADTAIERARNVLKSGRPAIAYDIAHTFVQQIGQDLGTYAWVEGEQAISHSFDGSASCLSASAGGYLQLDTRVPAPMSPYCATYVINATAEGVHELWIAGSAPEMGISPFSFSVDNASWQQVQHSSKSTYPGGFSWMKIGSANLTKGQHIIQIRVDGPAPDGAYKLAIDAIVLSPYEFKPNGIEKP